MKHKKLSVISNLVLLFSLVAPVFGANSGKKSPISLKNDQAIFRLGGQVYFLSDLKESQKSLGILSCASSGVLLDEYLGKDWKSLSAINLKSILNDTEALTILEPFVSLERLKNSVLSRGKDSLNKNELSALGKKCGVKSWDSLKVNDKAILLIEVYLRDRFPRTENLAESLGELKKGLKLKDKHEFFSVKASGALIKAKLKAKESETPSSDEIGEESAKVKVENAPSGN